MDLNLGKGRRLWERACRVLPGGVSSNVKMEERPQPMFFAHAEGSRLVDFDGNTYVDYTCGYGPVVLGHAYPTVVAALQHAAARGLVYGGQHEGEVLLAEQLVSLVPCLEMVRYNCTGSEAMAAAVRLARGHTGRTKVVRFAGHYHGWFDEQLISTHPAPDNGEAAHPESVGQSPSATEHLIVAPWNDAHALTRVFDAHGRDVAAVVMEPIMCNSGVIMPADGYLEHVRALCSEHGSVLIFDEVITGFRVHLGGAQAMLGVTPDLAVFGKAIANGFPLSCVGGRREIMERISSGGIVHAGTFNGNPLGVAAARATLEELARNEGAAYQRLTAVGQRLMQGIRQAAAARGIPVLLQGPGPVFYMWFTEAEAIGDYRASARVSREPYARFAVALLSAGVRVIPGGRWYISLSHSDDDVERTIAAVGRALDETPADALAVGARAGEGGEA
jgi:glutamate-1-semialdehyde 2,1-aminomutase